MDVGDDLAPTEWEWEKGNVSFVPKKTNAPIAPEYLLKVLRCCCTGDCGRKKCSCKRYGLECTSVCKHCNGESCCNSSSQVILDEEELDEIEFID